MSQEQEEGHHAFLRLCVCRGEGKVAKESFLQLVTLC